MSLFVLDPEVVTMVGSLGNRPISHIVFDCYPQDHSTLLVLRDGEEGTFISKTVFYKKIRLRKVVLTLRHSVNPFSYSYPERMC